MARHDRQAFCTQNTMERPLYWAVPVTAPELDGLATAHIVESEPAVGAGQGPCPPRGGGIEHSEDLLNRRPA